MSDQFELLVIGGGPAGLAAARGYRDAGGEGGVAIVSDEHRMPYRRPPLTKELLRGEIGEDELALEEDHWLVDTASCADLGSGGRARPRRARGCALRRPHTHLWSLRARHRGGAPTAADPRGRRPRGANRPRA